ncbi:EF-HAND CALCIUM-BINDING DOMAIN CONTAINING PROTEIN [Salix purpurea]|uniref:EF-HAND CALCIUM-BINDING DOMAIN CONTAINING PROTEIN n=1 Tax=Salix purpurea TaxID=77065 RepID=A0A9Q1ADA9_SALPP|nr:EF-HAND CALCIUM-BINDING DOMAIN CONTAINING PROTEIN [Salix purpurea]
MNIAALIFLLVLLAVQFASSRSIRNDFSILISDGLDQKDQNNILQLNNVGTTVTCEPIYGFMPCTTKVWGNLFLLVVYEYLLSLADKYISSGSNLFFQMFGTGLFGGSVFYVLAKFPQIVLVLVTLLSASEDVVGSAVSMSMGFLAGSTMMSLTIVWGYGVKTDIVTKYTARIILLSMIPYLILELSKAFNSSSATRAGVLIALIITVVLLVTYCTFQVFQPWIQDRTLEYLILSYVKKNLLQSLCNPHGRPIEFKIRQLFHKIDLNKNGQISEDEVRAFLVGIEAGVVGLIGDHCVSKVMEEFDFSGDHGISKKEFIRGISKWLDEANGVENNENQTEFECREEQKIWEAEQQDSKNSDEWNYSKATYSILLGTTIAVLLAKPLTKTLQELATAIKFPSFLVSYFLVPFALNFRQGYKSIISVTDKKEKSVSLTLSQGNVLVQIYCGVFMNNVLGLTSFLTIVYIRDVEWDITAEILVVLIICSGIGLSSSFSSIFPILDLSCSLCSISHISRLFFTFSPFLSDGVEGCSHQFVMLILFTGRDCKETINWIETHSLTHSYFTNLINRDLLC